MTDKEITQLTILLAMLQNAQVRLDELPIRAEFKYNLKHNCNKFTNELERFIKHLWKDLTEEDLQKYYVIARQVDYAFEAIEEGKVRIEDD